MNRTHYEVLGVPSDASVKEIRSAYHELLLRTHPDKTGVRDQNTRGPSISELKAAYAKLSDVCKRQVYDEELKNEFKKGGFNIDGAGLDLYTLSEFQELHVPEIDETSWSKDCPRCASMASIALSESDLENGTPDGSGGYQIVAPCSACSLWIAVTYEEAED